MTKSFRIERAIKPHIAASSGDPRSHKVLAEIPLYFPKWAGVDARAFAVEVYGVAIAKNLPQNLSEQDLRHALETEVLSDPLLDVSFSVLLPQKPRDGFKWWCLEKYFRPGVTDNSAHVLSEALALVCGQSIETMSGSRLWLELPTSIDCDEVSQYAAEVFHNAMIERVEVLDAAAASLPRVLPLGGLSQGPEVNDIDRHRVTVPLRNLSGEELDQISQDRLWALSRDEMLTVQNYYRGLGREPTEVEIEIIAQTWSEHCKHKIFASHIEVTNLRNDVILPSQVDSLFKTYIRGPTFQLKSPFLESVFEDNAGVISMTKEWSAAIKVETHNSPSALDPYGGALTGIVGVNRDILGVGLGALPIANVDVFCVGPLDAPTPLPPRLHHPRRILEGVRLGVEHGGNKSGIPTVSGAVVHHSGFLGKPLVFCGTVGLIPSKESSQRDLLKKEIRPGDSIVMVGGRIGKDGIHGATFSSLEMNENSPVSAVQLGDPLTQRRVWEFILEARDAGLYDAITDNGAGGLSSSIGELARLCGTKGGARLDVSKAFTKYPGLLAFELVVSESQERMSVSVPLEKLPAFLDLAVRRGVECSVLGTFEDSGTFEILYQGQTVGALDMAFLHEGVPTMQLKAKVVPPKTMPGGYGVAPVVGGNNSEPLQSLLLKVLSHPNVRSRRSLVQQYDHEVQGRTVRKPYGTKNQGAPGDGSTLRISRETYEGLALGLGLCPSLAPYDAKTAAELSIDEAVRNALVAGADPNHMALIDNFCWPDPLPGPTNPDAEDKLGALVITCQRLAEGALTMKMPFISGKDSMKNDYRMGNVKISVPPTVLITAMGKVHDVRRVPRGQIDAADLCLLWVSGQSVLPNKWGYPLVDFSAAGRFFRAFHDLVQQGAIAAAHDVSDGGWMAATAEMLLGSGFGAHLDVVLSSHFQHPFFEPATSFVLAVPSHQVAEIEHCLTGFFCQTVGVTTAEPVLKCQWTQGSVAVAQASWAVAELEEAYHEFS